jgi:hypothetical protein
VSISESLKQILISFMESNIYTKVETENQGCKYANFDCSHIVTEMTVRERHRSREGFVWVWLRGKPSLTVAVVSSRA